MESDILESPENEVAGDSKRPVVFISYSQVCKRKEKVLGLAASLKRDGCDVRIDIEKTSDEDWIQWMGRELDSADFVLCMVSQSYEERFRRDQNLDEGFGVAWEAGLIARNLYYNKWHNSRFLPCFLSRSDRKHIPLELTGYDDFLLDSEAGYEKLLRHIFNKPSQKLPDAGEQPELPTTTIQPLFGSVNEWSTSVSDAPDQPPENPESYERSIDSSLLDALLSQINRSEQKGPLAEYLLKPDTATQVGEIGAMCVITGAKAADCLNLFALTCLECFASNFHAEDERMPSADELMQTLRFSVVQSVQQHSLIGDGHRVGSKFQKEIECVDPQQWAVFYCHVDKAKNAIRIAEYFLAWRKKQYGTDGRKVLLVLFTDKIGITRTVPSLTCVVSSPGLIEQEHVNQWRIDIHGRTYLSDAQKQALKNALGKLKSKSASLLTIQDKLRSALDGV